ncbi:MAG TPA: hypothetical protein VHR41_21015 [Gemmatimonadales bacterium]|jgi:hypothetical protein|nr:hypothetical protein [Gemmatimonadales bacterium]
MKRGILAGGILALAFGTGCSSRTQERLVVTPPPRASERRGPAREVVVVERTHVPRGHAYGWWKQHGYREVTLYYDGTSYYSRQLEPTGFRAVIVYQREGRYYLPAEDDVHENRHGHHHDGDDDNN